MLRDLEPRDLPAILALNNAHAIEVNELTADGLARIVAVSVRARVVEGGLGFLVCFDESTPVQGPHHAWFLAHQRSFLYVDRVVIAAEARGRGLARLLYEDLASVAGGRPLCCEVNLEPPNPASLAFHERLGFTSLEEAVDPRNAKRVRYLQRRA